MHGSDGNPSRPQFPAFALPTNDHFTEASKTQRVITRSQRTAVGHHSPTDRGLARDQHYSARVGQARFASGRPRENITANLSAIGGKPLSSEFAARACASS